MLILKLKTLLQLQTILLFTTIISLAYGQATRTSNTGKNNYPRHLTLQELELLIRTETDTDFGYTSALSKGDAALEAQVESTWDDAIVYEWTKALHAETSSSQKYPYVLCHTGQNKSGYERRLALAAAIKSAQPESESEIYLHVLYNKDDSLCVFSQLYASVAINMSGDEYIVQPVLSSLKMIEGSVDEMKEKFDNVMSGKTYPTTIDIGLCPGVNVGANERNGMDNVERSFEKEGEDLKGVKDIAEAVTNMLLSGSGESEGLAGTSSSSPFLSLSQEVYLTSDAFIGQKTPSRAQMWGDLLETYQSSGRCDETYKTRLTWNGHRTNRPDLFPSQMQVVYNNAGETETDSGCALVLLLAISANPDVCSVEVRSGAVMDNQIAKFLTESEIVNVTPFETEGLDGSGEVVAVSDSGLDIDNCYFFDPNKPGAVGSPTGPGATIDLSHRKVVQYRAIADKIDDQFGHGTHVSGTIAGKRLGDKGAADGIAPGAKIAFIDLGLVNDLNDLLNTGRPHAKFHSASWGSRDDKDNPLNRYDAKASVYDEFMFENDDFLIIASAGNLGDKGGLFDVPNTVGNPAKNILTVGAQDSWGSSLAAGGIGPGFVADFSSRGPTADGRMKPDIMAPGKSVLSAGAQPNQTNECDSDPIPDPGEESEGLASKAGTSMSTPVVSASAAKIRQYFREGYHPSGKKNSNHAIPNPSAALIKAVLMNGAQPLLGVDNKAKENGGITRTKLYDIHQGFGRLSLQDSVYLHGKTNVQLKAWDRESVEVDGTNKYDVTIDKSQGCQAEDLSVTLVWMDQGSAFGCMECLLNDLDLSVSFGGKTHYPNGRGSPDRKNNVERVIINGVQHGETATISVNAHNILAAQNYALVATACFGGVANKLVGENVFDSQSAAPSTSPAPSTSSSPSASSAPSSAPSTSSSPSSQPSSGPSSAPSSQPSVSSAPSSRPSSSPSIFPSLMPSVYPSKSYFPPTPSVYQGPSVYAGQYNPYFNPSQNRYYSNQNYGQNQGYFNRGYNYNQGYNGQHGYGYGQLNSQQGYGGDGGNRYVGYTYQGNPSYKNVQEYQPYGWQNDAWGGGGQVSNIGHGVSQNRGAYGSYQWQGGGYGGSRYGYAGGQQGYYNPAHNYNYNQNQGYGYSQPIPYYNNQYNNRRNGGHRRLGKESMEEEAIENETGAGAAHNPTTAAAAAAAAAAETQSNSRQL